MLEYDGYVCVYAWIDNRLELIEEKENWKVGGLVGDNSGGDDWWFFKAENELERGLVVGWIFNTLRSRSRRWRRAATKLRPVVIAYQISLPFEPESRGWVSLPLKKRNRWCTISCFASTSHIVASCCWSISFINSSYNRWIQILRMMSDLLCLNTKVCCCNFSVSCTRRSIFSALSRSLSIRVSQP